MLYAGRRGSWLSLNREAPSGAEDGCRRNYRFTVSKASPFYRFLTVVRSNIRLTVSATGAINPFALRL